MTERKAGKETLVELVVRAFCVVQQLAAARHHHKKPPARSMVMLILDEVLCEVRDALGKQGYLKTGRTCIFLIDPEVVDVDFAHCRFSLVMWLIISWLRQSTLQGGDIIHSIYTGCKTNFVLLLKNFFRIPLFQSFFV